MPFSQVPYSPKAIDQTTPGTPHWLGDVSAPGAEIDCLHWLPLEPEPEPLCCVAHGAELPCRQCERSSLPPKLEAQP